MNALSAIAPRPRAASKLKFLSLMLVAAVALGPGVYTSAATTFGITTGNLTLNGGPNAVFIFPMGSTLDTAGLTQVLLTGGAQASIVFWQVGGSATLGIDSVFAGNVLALTSITVGAGANIDGRLLGENAQVTLGGGETTSSPLPRLPKPPPAPSSPRLGCLDWRSGTAGARPLEQPRPAGGDRSVRAGARGIFLRSGSADAASRLLKAARWLITGRDASGHP